MKNSNFIKRLKYKLRRKTGYNVKHKQSGKSFYRKQFRNLIVCMVIVLIILIIKKIDTEPTEKAINVVRETLNYNMDIKKDSKKAFDYVKGVIYKSEKISTVFNNEETLNVGYISPVTGNVYQSYGYEKKSDSIKIFRAGIKIRTMDTTVKSIGSGVVTNTRIDKLLGNQIIIDYGELKAIYGFLDEINVEKGEKVKKGEIIGRLRNNDKGEKLLYLEIKRENESIDPEKIIDITSKNLVSR